MRTNWAYIIIVGVFTSGCGNGAADPDLQHVFATLQGQIALDARPLHNTLASLSPGPLKPRQEVARSDCTGCCSHHHLPLPSSSSI